LHQTGALASKNTAFRRMNDVDSEFQLTQLEELGSREGRAGGADEGSLDGRSQDGSTHVPRSVIVTKHWNGM
jgi:hypothetical protein